MGDRFQLLRRWASVTRGSVSSVVGKSSNFLTSMWLSTSVTSSVAF